MSIFGYWTEESSGIGGCTPDVEGSTLVYVPFCLDIDGGVLKLIPLSSELFRLRGGLASPSACPSFFCLVPPPSDISPEPLSTLALRSLVSLREGQQKQLGTTPEKL